MCDQIQASFCQGSHATSQSSKENDRNIQEENMPVVLVSPVQPTETSKQEPSGLQISEDTSILHNSSIKTELNHDSPSMNYISRNESVQQEPPYEAPISRNFSSSNTAMKQPSISGFPVSDGTAVITDQVENIMANILPNHFSGDAEGLNKLHLFELKLNEADKAIIRLREENKKARKERDKLQKEMVSLGRRSSRVGFPFLFVVFTALFSLVLGYLLHT